LRARIAFRALIGAGLLLAWLGVLLPWERRESAASGFEETIGGFEASRVFWIVLAVATVLGVLALWRHWRWAFVALAVAALVLVGLAVLDLRASVDASSVFVDVVPGAGVILGLIGAAAIVSGVIVALRPPVLQLAAGLAAFAIVTGGAAAWPRDEGRPDDGGIADAGDHAARSMAFAGDTLYTLFGTRLLAQPAPDRDYDAAGVWASEWTPDDVRFDEFDPNGLAFSGDTAYVSLGGVDRLVSVTPDGEKRTLVARPAERRDPPVPAGAEQVEDFVAGPIAAGGDGSIYILQGDSIARWRAGELTTLAPRFGGASDIATDARGAVYVADTLNGRVHRIDPDGSVRTLAGTEAERRCVPRGLDDPLALDPRRCIAVKALAADREGNVYMALANLAMIVGVTPEGEMRVVAGTGPKGAGDGDGRAVRARLGLVERLAVGPDGDLYVSEAERVRRIADPAGILADDPPEEERQTEPPASCGEIVALNEAVAGITDGDALEGAINALADAPPEEIADDVDLIVDAATDREGALFEIQDTMQPDDDGVSLGEYAEDECGLVAGFDVPIDEANEFCVAFGRYADQDDLVEAGEEPPSAFEDVVEAAPDFLADAGSQTLRELERSAGREVPDSESVLAGAEAIQTVASAMCAAG
jgi:sugar lactone lactonase YvrE